MPFLGGFWGSDYSSVSIDGGDGTAGLPSALSETGDRPDSPLLIDPAVDVQLSTEPDASRYKNKVAESSTMKPTGFRAAFTPSEPEHNDEDKDELVPGQRLEIWDQLSRSWQAATFLQRVVPLSGPVQSKLLYAGETEPETYALPVGSYRKIRPFLRTVLDPSISAGPIATGTADTGAVDAQGLSANTYGDITDPAQGAALNPQPTPAQKFSTTPPLAPPPSSPSQASHHARLVDVGSLHKATCRSGNGLARTLSRLNMADTLKPDGDSAALGGVGGCDGGDMHDNLAASSLCVHSINDRDFGRRNCCGDNIATVDNIAGASAAVGCAVCGGRGTASGCHFYAFDRVFCSASCRTQWVQRPSSQPAILQLYPDAGPTRYIPVR